MPPEGHHWQLCGCQDCETYRDGQAAVAIAQENVVAGNLFVEITRDEMKAFLNSGQRPPDRYEVAGNEDVAIWTIWLRDRTGRTTERRASGIEVKLYTSFAHGSKEARTCGKDAIRVSLVFPSARGGAHGFPHIKRTAGWQDRVRERLHEAFVEANRKLREAYAPARSVA